MAYYQRNKERIAAQRHVYLIENPEKRKDSYTRSYARHRPKKMAKIYNISVERATELLNIKTCGICGNPATDTDR